MRLAEKDIEATIRDYLGNYEGWTVRKQERNFNRRKRKATGERGMADLLAIRYRRPNAPLAHVADRVCCELLWIETKAADGEPSEDQHKWHARERARGAQTVILGVDCPATIEGFLTWYRESKLGRRFAA